MDQKHCILEVGVRDVYIFDLFSSKGTYLNNERLKPLERLQLKNGDEFKVGVKKVKFVHERPDMVSRGFSRLLLLVKIILKIFNFMIHIYF